MSVNGNIRHELSNHETGKLERCPCKVVGGFFVDCLNSILIISLSAEIPHINDIFEAMKQVLDQNNLHFLCTQYFRYILYFTYSKCFYGLFHHILVKVSCFSMSIIVIPVYQNFCFIFSNLGFLTIDKLSLSQSSTYLYQFMVNYTVT